jgi:hypothetical protein
MITTRTQLDVVTRPFRDSNLVHASEHAVVSCMVLANALHPCIHNLRISLILRILLHGIH